MSCLLFAIKSTVTDAFKGRKYHEKVCHLSLSTQLLVFQMAFRMAIWYTARADRIAIWHAAQADRIAILHAARDDRIAIWHAAWADHKEV